MNMAPKWLKLLDLYASNTVGHRAIDLDFHVPRVKG